MRASKLEKFTKWVARKLLRPAELAPECFGFMSKLCPNKKVPMPKNGKTFDFSERAMRHIALRVALVGFLLRVTGFPQRIEDLIDRRAESRSVAAAISLLAIDDDAEQQRQEEQQASSGQQQQPRRQQEQQQQEQQQEQSAHTVRKLGSEDASDSSAVPPAGRLHQIAGSFAKRTVVLSTDAVERFSSTGIPAYGLAIVVVLGTVLVFLLCWCIAYGMCMCWAEREALQGARRHKPHKRDRLS
jgi:hypothetical protein